MKKLGESLPFTLFFLREWEARFATIAGDIMINKVHYISEIVELFENIE